MPVPVDERWVTRTQRKKSRVVRTLWAKGAEAVIVKITLQGNKTRFRESDVQQSLHAAMRRQDRGGLVGAGTS